MVKKISQRRLEALKGSGALVSPKPKEPVKPDPVAAPVVQPTPQPADTEMIREVVGKEMAGVTAALDNMAKILPSMVADRPNPATKIKVRNITRCSKGRMKDADLIIEREPVAVH
tara:strand:+ start:322 stop:666 length:345 start_codon:yes stop_codon:yes gene_type:complete